MGAEDGPGSTKVTGAQEWGCSEGRGVQVGPLHVGGIHGVEKFKETETLGKLPLYFICGILVPQPGTKPEPLAVGDGVLTSGPPGTS